MAQPPAIPTEIEEIELTHGDLRFRALSLGEGPLVLCLHGFPDDARSFRFQMAAIADAGYRVVAPQLRGYEPASQPRDGDYRVEALAGDVVSWIEQLGVSTAHLVGHDWGAVITFVSGALHPDRFSSLATLAVPHSARFPSIGLRKVPIQLVRSAYMMFFQLRGIAEYAIRRKDWALLERLWKIWSPGFDLPDEEWASLRKTFSAPGVAKAMLSYYRQNAAPSIMLGLRDAAMTRLTTIPVRMLAITGADDGCMDTRLYDHVFLEEDFPEGVRVERIMDAGHFVHQEKPNEVNRLLVEWFSGG
jgi:pimeloyl-ACP methyl ester carboxylesterase